ncbi:MAG: gamma-glutamyltransferase, partial [Mariprofundaceae bacterium]|nr:gamma-glutamyltransferase [Mariprofundaceae bacterium]
MALSPFPIRYITRALIYCAAALSATSPLPVFATTAPIQNYAAIAQPVWAKNAMVSTQQHIATRVGVDILRGGGNAVDAAVAIGFTLAVTLPRAGNLGGGGFMLIYLAQQNKTLALDYREMAPAAAHRDMYLNEDGSVDKNRS